MSLLIVGNSHIVGLREALGERGTAACVPIPLCGNFEAAVRDGSGQFIVDAGWKNMGSDIGAQAKQVVFDFGAPDRHLVIVGMKLFGCFPLFRPLIADQDQLRLPICIGRRAADVPVSPRYQLVSESCLRNAFADQMTGLINAHAWLAGRFDSTTWIASPPPPMAFARARFKREHQWFIGSGLFATTVELFNEAIEQVNGSPAARQFQFRFAPHMLAALDPHSGFLAEAFAHNPQVPLDIHASARYYEPYVAEFVK